MILSYVSLTAVSAYLTDYPSVFNAGFQTCCPMIRPRFCQKKGSLSVLLLQKCQYHHWKQADVRGVSKVKKKKKKKGILLFLQTFATRHLFHVCIPRVVFLLPEAQRACSWLPECRREWLQPRCCRRGWARPALRWTPGRPQQRKG